MSLRKLTLKCISALSFLCLSIGAQAIVQQHNFTVSGSGGTGSGFFTWDDAVIANGLDLPTVNVLSFSLTLSGGVVVSSPTTFTLADCSDFFLQTTPDFLIDLNMNCDNGTNTITAIDFPYGAGLNSGATNITFAPPPPPPIPAPTLSEWTLILLALALAGIGYTAAMKTKES